MRIGHYSFQPWEPGGISSYIRRLSRAQQERGDEVVLLSRDAPDESPDGTPDLFVTGTSEEVFATAEDLQLDVLHLHRPVNPLPDDRLPTVRTMHGNQGSCPAGSRFLERSKTPCDRTAGLLPCLWGHLVDHCGSRRPHNIAANFSNFRHEQALSEVVPTMTVSQFVRDTMVEAGTPPEQLHVVHSPAPLIPGPIPPPPQDETPHFAFVGRIEPNKGVEWFLRAVAQCSLPIHADLAGTGRDQHVEFITRRIVELGLSDQVTVHGWLTEPEVNALYRRARAVVVPSLWHEPAGLVTLEAAAAGRAVLASRVGGIPEYADPDFSLLADPGDVATLAGHLATLAQDWERAWSMGRAGRERMQAEYTLDRFLRNVDHVYSIAGASRSEIDRGCPEGATN